MYIGAAEGAESSRVPGVLEISVGGSVQRSSPCVLGAAGFAVLDLAGNGAIGCGSGLHAKLELAIRRCGLAERETLRLGELVLAWDAADRPSADRLRIDAYPSGTPTPGTEGSVHPARYMTFVVSSM
jgi:hypothetical protein